MEKKPPTPPHPSYGYLTKDEYERAKNAGAGVAAHYKKLAEKRRKESRKKK